jgi:glycosyltransferase involved in cell wall biosynthesis
VSRVDVIIPCYKYGHFLSDCVESVLTQEGVDVRALILDDASPDNTQEVAEGLARWDPRVTYRRHAVNQGHIATYNEGLQWVDGDYVVLLSADDMLTPGSLRRACTVMDSHTEVSMTYGAVVKIFPGQELPAAHGVSASSAYRLVSGLRFIESVCETGENPVPTPTAVTRRSVQDKAGGYRPELPHAGDMEMWMRLAAHGCVGVLEAHQAFYRFHDANMHRPYTSRPVKDSEERKAAFTLFFQQLSAEFPQRKRLESLAQRGVALQAYWVAVGAFERGDGGTYEELIEFALDHYPDLRTTSEWRKLCLKRLLGPFLWAKVRPVLRGLRAAASVTTRSV